MAWIEAKAARGHKCDGVTLALYLNKSGAWHLCLHFGEPVLTAAGWRKDERVKLLLGTDEHRGSLRLVADPKGLKLGDRNKDSRSADLKVSPTILPHFEREKRKATVVAWSAPAPGVVEVILPGWAGGRRLGEQGLRFDQ
jgi:hypothetical protein